MKISGLAGVLGFLSISLGQMASAKDQTCFWKDEGLAEWNFHGVHGLVVQEQPDGSYTAYDASWTRPNDGSEPDPSRVTRTGHEPVQCQFATDSVLLHCSSTRIWKNYDITLISETLMSRNGSQSTQSAIEAVVTTFPENDEDMVKINRHRVRCANTAVFENIVDQQLRIR